MTLLPSESHIFSAQIDCRYLLHLPAHPRPLLVLALHGYGSTPETMLRLTMPLVGEARIVAAVQAPHQHYGAVSSGSPAETAYNWGVRDHHESSVRTHHAIVLTVLDQLRGRFGIPAARCLLLGFSQPVGLNYRFIGTHPGAAGGVIGICGGVPRDWEDSKYHPIAAPILHIARDQDEIFPPDTARGFPDRLRTHAADVEFHMLPGRHRFPSKAGAVVQPWLHRVFGP